MQFIVVGILDGYREAEEAVQDLELAGIVGEQVEVISDVDEDARTADTPGEPSTKPHEAHHSRLARLFGAGGALARPEVRDLSGEQPNYIGDQEYYATHVKQGAAVMIIRAASEPIANRAAAILHNHGGRTRGHKDAPVVRRIE